MDKRKLIGTIIGIIMFAALIVGATYAWLSFNANVINSTANGTTLSYWVNYEKGTDITELPILVTPTKSNASLVTVTAKRPQGSIADNIKLYLTTTSATSLSTSGAVSYIVCVSETDNAYSVTPADDAKAYECDENFSGREIRTVTATSTVEIYSGTLPGTTTSNANDTVTYHIYFWLDAETTVNAHVGQTYSGYIHAESVQSETTYG